MARIGEIQPEAAVLNRAREDLIRLMINNGATSQEAETNMSVLERFIDACIAWKMSQRY